MAREKDDKLYFLLENRNQLPSDILQLTKLDLVKDETISHYNRNIHRLEEDILSSSNTNASRLEWNVNKIELEFQQNQHTLNYTKITYDDLINRQKEISKSKSKNNKSPKCEEL
jgi:DNA-binding protein H-NS